MVPIFAPPDGLSAAAMRYITRMGADSRAFAAALVELGVGGHIRLTEEEGGFFRRGQDDDREDRRPDDARRSRRRRCCRGCSPAAIRS